MVLAHHYVFQAISTPPATLASYFLAAGRLAWSGVDLFFVLSGFLIGGILLDTRQASNYFRVFYTRRFFRIVPLYLVFLGAMFALSCLGQLGITRFSWIFKDQLPWMAHLFFLQNFWMASRTTFGALCLTVTWSLAVEEQFYLTLPVLVRFLKPRWLLWMAIACVVTAPILRIALHARWPEHHLSWFVLMPCRADSLLLGVLAAAAIRSERAREILKRNPSAVCGVLVFLGGGLFWFTKYAADPYGVGMLTLGYTWLALFYAFLLIYAVSYRGSWLSAVLRTPHLMSLGSIAYGVYLFHEFFRNVLLGTIGSSKPVSSSGWGLVVSFAALALTIRICRASWSFLEEPLLRYGRVERYQMLEGREGRLVATLTPQIASIEGS
jgi:peptidoglycan/LPS O-acetylase OafA/YrhL